MNEEASKTFRSAPPILGCLRLRSCLYCVKYANKRLKYCSFLFMFNLHLTVIDAIKQPRIL